jgi:hypothetical protein
VIQKVYSESVHCIEVQVLYSILICYFKNCNTSNFISKLHCEMSKFIFSKSVRLLNSKYMQTRLNSIVPFNLTDIGEGIAEVELLKWFIKVRLYFYFVLILFICPNLGW